MIENICVVKMKIIKLFSTEQIKFKDDAVYMIVY